MIESIKSRALRRYWERGDERGIRPDWLKKTRIVLDALNAASRPEDLDLPGLGFHALRENRAGEFAVNVSRNWRITFRWSGTGATDVNLEDYHGT
jgi:proteic killer suppression protein